MSPRAIGREIVRSVTLLRADQDLRSAARDVVASGVPALPVIDARERFAGIFGEREFIAAVFPRYLGELHYAAFVPSTLDEVIEQADLGSETVSRHMNTEHVDAAPDCSDVQLAETFLHHRVLIVPLVARGEVGGIVTRSDFFEAIAARVQP